MENSAVRTVTIRSDRKIHVLEMPVAILLFIERNATSDPVWIVENIAVPNGTAKISVIIVDITNVLFMNLGCWKGRRCISSVQVLKIRKNAMATENTRLLIKSFVLKNLKKDDLKARIMRFRPSWQQDS